MERKHLVPQFHLLLLLAAWAYNPFPKMIKFETSSFFPPHSSCWKSAVTCFSECWNLLILIINTFMDSFPLVTLPNIFCPNIWSVLTQFIPPLLSVHSIRACHLPSWNPVCFSEDITSQNPCLSLCYYSLFYPAFQHIWLSLSQVIKH